MAKNILLGYYLYVCYIDANYRVFYCTISVTTSRPRNKLYREVWQVKCIFWYKY